MKTLPVAGFAGDYSQVSLRAQRSNLIANVEIASSQQPLPRNPGTARQGRCDTTKMCAITSVVSLTNPDEGAIITEDDLG
ncbi:MAG TPA: hypothetical protein VF429_07555, partial [Anaerolineae bacterium]